MFFITHFSENLVSHKEITLKGIKFVVLDISLLHFICTISHNFSMIWNRLCKVGWNRTTFIRIGKSHTHVYAQVFLSSPLNLIYFHSTSISLVMISFHIVLFSFPGLRRSFFFKSYIFL